MEDANSHFTMFGRVEGDFEDDPSNFLIVIIKEITLNFMGAGLMLEEGVNIVPAFSFLFLTLIAA